MSSQTATTNAGAVLALLGVLGLCMPLHTAQAGNDRIFTDGFEPCCQVGGTVSGLTGSGPVLLLSLSGNLPNEPHVVSGNGAYQFLTNVPPGTSYAVSITVQPSSQICSIANATDIMGNTDVDNIDITCAATSDLVWDQGQWGDNWQ